MDKHAELLPPPRRELRRRTNLEQILKRRLQLDFVVGTPENTVQQEQQVEKPKFAFYDYLGKSSDETTTCEENPGVSNVGLTQGVIKTDLAEKNGLYPSLIDHLSPATRSVLECPACRQCMQPPINLCVQGHRICPKCLPVISMCPKCRGQYTGSRDNALEDLYRSVTMDCEECGLRIATRSLDAHQRVCKITWVDL